MIEELILEISFKTLFSIKKIQSKDLKSSLCDLNIVRVNGKIQYDFVFKTENDFLIK